jgi:hypothetical protein
MLVGAPNGDDGSAAGEGGGNNRTKKRGEIRPVEKHHMMLDKEQVGTGEWKENGERRERKGRRHWVVLGERGVGEGRKQR